MGVSRDSRRGPWDGRGFTLIELLVVITVLALLVAILMPSFGQAFEVAHMVDCRSHLRHLSEALRAPALHSTLRKDGGDCWTLPAGPAWTAAAVQYGSRDLLVCRKDIEPHSSGKVLDPLKDYYLLQAHAGGRSWWVSNLAAVLGMGDGVIQDPQIHYRDIPATPQPHTGRHPCWCNIPVRTKNQHFVAIQDEAEILITFEPDRIVIESFVGCGATHCGSDHWLMKGHCTDGPQCLQQDQVILRLAGRHYQKVDPNSPYVIPLYNDKNSYGINGLVESRRHGPGQLLLMDANQIVIDPERPGWLDHVKARHFGKVNYVTVEGAVGSATKAQLRDEFTLFEQAGPTGESFWGPRGYFKKERH